MADQPFFLQAEKNQSVRHRLVTAQIDVTGIVQGVGFRPTVWRYAKQSALTGKVLNTGQGVRITCTGQYTQIKAMLTLLREKPPALARIEDITLTLLSKIQHFDHFDIAESLSKQDFKINSIGPDAVTCKDCLKDITKPGRRHRYAFTNCTHCGPRLSITKQGPYDRSNTSMAEFVQCESCQQEYEDPANRRFHAQPNACAKCGPRLWLTEPAGAEINCADPVKQAAHALDAGKVVAIKGLGGFQLAVRADIAAAVARLRTRKHRPFKPFAVMTKTIEQAAQLAFINQAEKQLMESAAGPIVIVPQRLSALLLHGVSPTQSNIGLFLPTTPLHHLLLNEVGGPLVMTSGNRRGQPQAITNDTALADLADIADLFVLHDREIEHRVDDSVAQVQNGKPVLLRRARGYAPASLPTPKGFEQSLPTLGVGADLKNTVCFLDAKQAVISQHFGDLNDVSTISEQHAGIQRYQQFLNFTPMQLGVDQHPEYQSRKFALESAEVNGVVVENVQHHHAHIASCLGEHAYHRQAPAVLGIVLDGLGYAEQDTSHSIWGGEVLLADYNTARNLGGLKPIPLLGGEQANLQPWRNTVAQLHNAIGWQKAANHYANLPLIKALQSQPVDTLIAMQHKGVNAPLSSSCGRLFDAVAVASGVFGLDSLSYEAHAAMALESVIEPSLWDSVVPYPFSIETDQGRRLIDPSSMWLALLEDLTNNQNAGFISARFHLGLASVFATLTQQLAEQHSVKTVVLTGGVFANKHLHDALYSRLQSMDLNVLTHSKVPCNDGGLAFGQALITASRQIERANGGLTCV